MTYERTWDDFLGHINSGLSRYNMHLSGDIIANDGYTTRRLLLTHDGRYMFGPDDDSNLYDVMLCESGDKKIHVIKVVRQITHYGLKAAKELVVDRTNGWNPVSLGVTMSIGEAHNAVRTLEEAGASAEIIRVSVSPEELAQTIESLQRIDATLQKECNGE